VFISRHARCPLICHPSQSQAGRLCCQALSKLPVLQGAPIRLEFLPCLTARRGQLHSNESHGQAVHAATFLRKRSITLDAELTRQPSELKRILIHELFHFIWVRLGNKRRNTWQILIEQELRARSRGELGWSAQWRKDTGRWSGRPWREYLCESFCDTAAWFYARRAHEEFTLAPRFRARRAGWMKELVGSGFLPI